MRSLFLAVAMMLAAAPGPRQDGRRPPAAPPNVVVILADDLGYGELGSYGQQKIRTPTLDRLAAEGMRFTQFYAGSTVCAPSRATLLTGRHTGRAFVRDNYELGGSLDEEERGQLALPPDHPTVARALRAHGYTTAAVGKWGLGGPGSTGVPSKQGFDFFFGYLDQKQAHNYYPTHLWRNEERYPLGNSYFSPHQLLEGDPGDPKSYEKYRGADYAIDVMTREAVGWIRTHASKPFFLYFAPTLPHLALQVPAAALAHYEGRFPETPYAGDKRYLPHRTPRAAYAAMITYLDAQVAQIMQVLEDTGLDDRTVVLFTSDNGATFNVGGAPTQFFESNGALRGHKQDLYEGGIRVPMIARWPGRIRAGTRSDHVGANWDIWATLAEIAGTRPPADTDGVSFAPTLVGSGAQRTHEALYWEYHSLGGAQAVRIGRWKGIRLNADKQPDGPIALYDLQRDPAETTNVAAANPAIVRKVADAMTRAHTRSDVPRWNFGGRAAATSARTPRGPR